MLAIDRPRGDDLHVYPLLIEATPKAGLDRVRDLNLRPPRREDPPQRYPLADRNQQICDAADEIVVMATAMAEKAAQQPEHELPDLLTPELEELLGR